MVFKLDQPRQISMIEIGNENSGRYKYPCKYLDKPFNNHINLFLLGMIEVLVGNSLQDPPIYKEILLSTSFMTIIGRKYFILNSTIMLIIHFNPEK